MAFTRKMGKRLKMTFTDSRYTLVKQIARGGMAEIYLAVQIGQDGFQRILAIKRILPHFASEHEFVDMFRDEAHIGKRLQHANIVKVEGFEEVEGAPAIIMEFIDGADLRTLLVACAKSGARLSVPMALHVVAECARGLHYAHTKVDEITNKPLEIVHRDISPQNVLISYEGEVKVTDFGIAHAESKNTDTKPGVVKGKYSYMSPEQISGKDVDARTDVFALCIVLWEILAMHRLFAGDNEALIIQMVRNCEIPQNLMELNPNVDSELAALIQKGLQKDRKNRYQSAEELERRLRVYLNKNFPGFSPTALSDLLREVLAKRRTEIQYEIKHALTKSNLRPGLRSGNSGHTQSQVTPIGTRGHNITFTNPAPGASAIKLATRGVPVNRKQLHKQVARHLNSKHDPQGSYRRIVSGSTKAKSSSLTAQILGLIFLCFFGFMGLTYWQKFLAKTAVTDFTINVLPDKVKLKLDDVWLEGGQYISTPYVIHNLRRGRHTLTLQRSGYGTQRYSFTVKSSRPLNKDNFMLRSKARFASARFVLDAAESGAFKYNPVIVSVEGGRDRGPVPLLSNDLFPRQKTNLTVYPDDSKNPKSTFDCSFTPESLDQQVVQIVIISIKKKTCTLVDN